MIDLSLVHTAHLTAPDRDAIRALLYDAFDDMTDADVEHAGGGLHALAHDDGVLVGHAAVVMRRLLHGGRALRCGYVEGVGVRADRRRSGIGDALMSRIDEVVRAAYDLGALGASDVGARLYTSRGWVQWRGTLSALTPDGIAPTPDERGAVYVLPVADGIDPDGELTCDWRDGDLW